MSQFKHQNKAALELLVYSIIARIGICGNLITANSILIKILLSYRCLFGKKGQDMPKCPSPTQGQIHGILYRL